MESFYGENPGIDNSGTNEEPLNLGWIRELREFYLQKIFWLIKN